MQSTRRRMHRPRFTLRTLLVLFVVINVCIFIIVNYCMIPNKDERDDDPTLLIFLKNNGPDVAELWSKVQTGLTLDTGHLKEDSHDDDHKNLSEDIAQPDTGSELERSPFNGNNSQSPTISTGINAQGHETLQTLQTNTSLKTQINNIFLTERKKLGTGNPNRVMSYVQSVAKDNMTRTGADRQSTANVKPALPTTLPALSQSIVDSIATNMEVRFEVLENFHTGVFTLRNKGRTPIERNGWSMHVCITTGMELGHLQHRPQGFILPSKKSLKITHLNGCSYKVEPTRDFETIFPGKSLEIAVHIGTTSVKSDVAPRWYIAAEGFEPRTISNTASEQLDFVVIPNKWKSWDGFRNNDVADLGKAPLLVIPTPAQIVKSKESKKLSIEDDWVVFGEPGLEEETSFLAGKLNIEKSMSQATESKVIKLAVDKTAEATKQQSGQQSTQESYHLEVNATRQLISITGTENAGVFYGVQSLLALIGEHSEVPELSIKDSPRFSHRGLMVDVARNFQPKHEILRLLDVMAMYKMNKFHFHLTDNEGWRLEMPGIEELTSVGSKRCHDLQERTCIFSHLGSGPHTNSSGTGFYTTEDYRDILRHAKKRHIQVIPEFDFPGHSHAAIKSMIARHDKLVQQGSVKEAEEFLISDLKDGSHYFSIQFFTDETANPCMNSTYKFLGHILRELINLHRDIQPLTVFHFGGDEVPGRAWTKSPACEKLARILDFRYNSDYAHKKLKENFLKRLSNITAELNLALAGWGDFLFNKKTRTVLPRKFFSNKDVYSFAWSVTGAAKRSQEISLMANNGYQVVLSNPDYIYFDHPYEPHPEERGKNWATPYTDTRKVFGFMPEDLYKDIDSKEFNCSGLRCSEGRQNVLGIEAAMWGETVRNGDHLYYMLFPRLLALAERAWHRAPWEEISDMGVRERERSADWANFANTLGYRELGRLDKMNITYRVPPPAVRIIDKRLETRVALPGLKVQYSTDDGLTWNDVTSDVEVDGNIKLWTRSADGRRVSREVEVEPRTPPPTKKTIQNQENKQSIDTNSFKGTASRRRPRQ